MIQEVNSNGALWLSISVLRDHCVSVSFLPSFKAFGIPHHHWTNHMDQTMIDKIHKP